MRYIFLLALIMMALPAFAAGDSYYLEDLTWPEVKERMARGVDTVIIPSGGTEQNGPHIAIGKHNRIVRYTSGEIARQLGNALAAPVLAYVPEGRVNPPEGHMLFPGTISVNEEDFARVLEDAARSFKQEGFKHICFIGDHGGNQKVQQEVADKLNREWKNEGITVINVSDYYNDREADAWARKLGIKSPDAHAGFMDASEIMAIDGGVRPALIRHYSEKDFAASGVMGDPSGATAEYGKTLLDFKVKAAVEQIRRETGQSAGGK
ncbi:MAG: creatininase family protein [Pseudomonadota bacterium]|nr:creatininase family protein [Pseudomonadota bacterium]